MKTFELPPFSMDAEERLVAAGYEIGCGLDAKIIASYAFRSAFLAALYGDDAEGLKAARQMTFHELTKHLTKALNPNEEFEPGKPVDSGTAAES